MAFCKNCGQEMVEGATFCPGCGNKIADGAEQTTSLSVDKGFFTSLFDFSMKEIITPKIIRILFVISVVLAGIFSLIMLITLFVNGAGTGVLGLILVPIGFILSVIMIRVYLEIIIVLFNIYAEMKCVNSKLSKGE